MTGCGKAGTKSRKKSPLILSAAVWVRQVAAHQQNRRFVERPTRQVQRPLTEDWIRFAWEAGLAFDPSFRFGLHDPSYACNTCVRHGGCKGHDVSQNVLITAAASDR